MRRNTPSFPGVWIAFSLSAFLCFQGHSQTDSESSQVVVVLTKSWEATDGRLATFSKSSGGWRMWRKPIPVTVGHKGLGWGEGLHGNKEDGPQKREGDKRAPAGVFPLEFGFGALPFRSQKFSYYKVDDRDRWVDDPKSRFYNQWTRLEDPRFPKDWTSEEVMRRPDGIYNHVIVVGHNRSPITPGHGSAIFLHQWYGPGRSTIGCTAMEKGEVKRLLGWLDSKAQPILVQAPSSELSELGL